MTYAQRQLERIGFFDDKKQGFYCRAYENIKPDCTWQGVFMGNSINLTAAQSALRNAIKQAESAGVKEALKGHATDLSTTLWEKISDLTVSSNDLNLAKYALGRLELDPKWKFENDSKEKLVGAMRDVVNAVQARNNEQGPGFWSPQLKDAVNKAQNFKLDGKNLEEFVKQLPQVKEAWSWDPKDFNEQSLFKRLEDGVATKQDKRVLDTYKIAIQSRSLAAQSKSLGENQKDDLHVTPKQYDEAFNKLVEISDAVDEVLKIQNDNVKQNELAKDLTTEGLAELREKEAAAAKPHKYTKQELKAMTNGGDVPSTWDLLNPSNIANSWKNRRK